MADQNNSQVGSLGGDRLRVQFLFRQATSPFIALFVISPVCVFVLRGSASTAFLLLWLGAVYLVTIVRVVHVRFFFRRETVDPLRWETEYSLGALGSGLLWAVVATYFYPSHSPLHQAFITFVVAGVSAGAVASYAASPRSAGLFLVSLLFPFACRLFAERTEIHTTMGVMALVYLGLFLQISARVASYMREYLLLSGEHERLSKQARGMDADLAASLLKFEQSQVEMVHASRLAAVGEMSAGIAHEINNPLAVIEGVSARILSLAGSGKIDEETLVTNMEKIRSMVERISHLIRGLLNFSASSRRMEKVASPIHRIIDQSLDLCRQRFLSNQVDLKVGAISPDLLVSCLPIQISQVTLNLLNNAFDAVCNLPERWVRLEVRELVDSVEIAVTDSGKIPLGAAPENWFHPFYTTKDVGKGTGLGLSVSKGIMEMHGGRIWVDTSSLNTRVVFSLPRPALTSAWRKVG